MPMRSPQGRVHGGSTTGIPHLGPDVMPMNIYISIVNSHITTFWWVRFAPMRRTDRTLRELGVLILGKWWVVLDSNQRPIG